MSSTMLSAGPVTLAEVGPWPGAAEVTCADGTVRVVLEVYAGRRDAFARGPGRDRDWIDCDDGDGGPDLLGWSDGDDDDDDDGEAGRGDR